MSTSGLVLVLADRNVQVQALAKSFLNEAGIEVQVASDGVMALELLRRLRAPVLVAEILLPKLDGLALCRKVKADPELMQTRVLIFSMLAAKVRAQQAGADGFLSKPLAQERLASALHKLLAGT